MVYWAERCIGFVLVLVCYFVDFSAFSFFYLLHSACVVTTRIEKAVKSIKLRIEEGKCAQKIMCRLSGWYAHYKGGYYG